MKNFMLLVAGIFILQCSMAQLSSNHSVGKTGSGDFIPIDDSFSLTPDTLWFVTGNDFVEGKPFQIINNHNYSIDVLHIDQSGAACPTCLPWYTAPFYSVYPVTVLANSGITTTVRFLVIDRPRSILVYDTLNVNTAGYSAHLIIAADSNMVQIGIAEPGKVTIMAAPNPFSEAVRISLHSSAGEKVTVTVYDALLRSVNELFSGKTTSEIQSMVWNGDDQYGNLLGKGVYFINLRTEKGQKTLKIVKI
ncbi:MAG: T9SS type A sorting domain-containing protein [Bacteroidota bacterium]